MHLYVIEDAPFCKQSKIKKRIVHIANYHRLDGTPNRVIYLNDFNSLMYTMLTTMNVEKTIHLIEQAFLIQSW